MNGPRYTRCKKLGYQDELGAKMALADAQNRPSGRRMELRYYRCPACRMYHLTSQPKVTQ